MKQIAAASFLIISTTSAAFPRHATRILHNVKGQMQRRPALTHAVVGFGLFGASDAFAQKLEASALREEAKIADKNDSSASLSRDTFSTNDLDMVRFLSAGVIGAFFGGCVYPFAYKRLDMIWKGNGFMSIAKKSVLEVFTVGIFANSVSMGARGVLVGKNPMEVFSHVKKEMPEVTLNDLRVWFPYNMVAFGLIPISIRPATTSLMECLWQTYISYRSNDYGHGQTCEDTMTMQI
eukprot:CAMPEP_0183710148 /NCGR_PEP_ID=MMETSP0737-20130205/5973_1 /TAXON_ID=385413 /ORGANISM="Thalassiosira miniscula, Strain CCMP1093" /LENGTH=235 /DNA_ID=CAMNT_0025938371 /DNA_START=326 /DNA_END=1033 /DNA_ORIENTATION=+